MKEGDDLVVEFTIKLYRKPDGTCYVYTKNNILECATSPELALVGLYLDKEKQDLIEGLIPDVEVEHFSPGLYDT